MIDNQGHVRCSQCNKAHGVKLEGKFEWYCPRCGFFNREDTRKINRLDKRDNSVVLSELR